MHLGTLGLRMWDESRNAVNALEMSVNGNYIVRYYNGHPDDWELKPPLLIWLQMLFLKILGYNETALRLPSAISSLLIIVIIIYFLKKEFSNNYAGFLSGLVLITSPGYLGEHTGRTGDHDLLLCLWMTLSILFFYKFIFYNNYLFSGLFFLGLILGYFTKSIASLMFLPGMLFFTIHQGKFLYLIKNWKTWIGVLFTTLLIFAYYYFREQQQPGYINLVWNNELFPRYINSEEKFNNEDAFYYLRNLYLERFAHGIFFLPIAIFFILKRANEKVKSFVLLLVYCIFSYTIILSLGSKNYWYDAPLFPLLSIINGLGFFYLIEMVLINLNSDSTGNKIVVITFFIIGVFGNAYQEIIERVYKPKNYQNDLEYGGFMKKLQKNSPEKKNYTILFEGYNAPLMFYSGVYNYVNGYEIKITENIQKIRINDLVMSCEDEQVIENLESQFEIEIQEKYKNCNLYKIIRKKITK